MRSRLGLNTTIAWSVVINLALPPANIIGKSLALQFFLPRFIFIFIYYYYFYRLIVDIAEESCAANVPIRWYPSSSSI